MDIPILDLRGDIEANWNEYNEAIRRVLSSCQFIGGPEVQAFEEELKKYFNVRHAISVNSGTDALTIGLRMLEIKPGDEVITSPFTFFATAEAISNIGAVPVFVDINLDSFNIDPTKIEQKITKRTKAILPVHLFGLPAQMDEILSIARKYNLKIIEDCAQAFGAEYKGKKVGTIGDIGAFSFFPSKNLGAFGDGGMILTNADNCAEVGKMLKSHGSRKRYYHEMLGYNSRLDAIQAAILRVKLKNVEKANAHRKLAAQRYNNYFKNLNEIIIPKEYEKSSHVFHQYTLRILNGKRDKVRKNLAENGVQTMVYYPIPINKLPVYNYSEPLKNAMIAAQEVLSIPIGPTISEETQKKVAKKIIESL